MCPLKTQCDVFVKSSNVPPLNNEVELNVPPSNILGFYLLQCITRFLGGTFGQNLVGGGTKTFYTAGDITLLRLLLLPDREAPGNNKLNC